MTVQGKEHRIHHGKDRVLVGAITAVIAAGIAMQLVAVVMLAIPNLSFDASNPAILYPIYYVALAIIGIGVGTTLSGARLAIKIANRVGSTILTCHADDSRDGRQLLARAVASAGPTIIRPALVKKEVIEPAATLKATSTPHGSTPAPPSPPSPAAMEMPASSGPADMESLKSALDQISERYSRPDVRSKFDGWVNNLVMMFPDLNKAYTFKIKGAEGIDMSEGMDDNAAVQVTMASDMFVKLLSKQINAIKAYSSGALKVKGEMKNLLKLRKLMF